MVRHYLNSYSYSQLAKKSRNSKKEKMTQGETFELINVTAQKMQALIKNYLNLQRRQISIPLSLHWQWC